MLLSATRALTHHKHCRASKRWFRSRIVRACLTPVQSGAHLSYFAKYLKMALIKANDTGLHIYRRSKVRPLRTRGGPGEVRQPYRTCLDPRRHWQIDTPGAVPTLTAQKTSVKYHWPLLKHWGVS
jgi:hypothetical protein